MQLDFIHSVTSQIDQIYPQCFAHHRRLDWCNLCRNGVMLPTTYLAVIDQELNSLMKIIDKPMAGY